MQRRTLLGTGIAALAVPAQAAEASPAALKTAFLLWLDEAGLKVPIVIKNVADDRVRFGFEGCTSALRGWIGQRDGFSGAEMLIDAEYNGVWDGLVWPDDVRPEPRKRGWVCATCESEGHAVLFPTAAAIWRDHLFDCLAAWINETLEPATHLAFHDDNGSTWVTLTKEASVGATYLVRLRNDRNPIRGRKG